jgi:ATP-dependent Clp protease ATP-binding subunit ClpA
MSARSSCSARPRWVSPPPARRLSTTRTRCGEGARGGQAHLQARVPQPHLDIIVFRPLNKKDLLKIVEIEAVKVIKRLSARKILLEFTPESKTLLIEKGYDEKYGARPLRRAVEHYLEDPLAEALLRGEVKDGEPILVVRNGDKLEFKTKSPTAESGVAT